MKVLTIPATAPADPGVIEFDQTTWADHQTVIETREFIARKWRDLPEFEE